MSMTSRNATANTMNISGQATPTGLSAALFDLGLSSARELVAQAQTTARTTKN